MIHPRKPSTILMADDEAGPERAMIRLASRVLIVDHDREDVELVGDLWREATGQELDCIWASTYEEGLRLLRDGEVDVCLLDHRLGAWTGIDFLREPEVASSGVPVILMTARGTAEEDRSAMDAGAADYLGKEGLTGAALERTVRYAAERRRRQRAEAQVNALIGNLQELVSVIEPDGSFRYVSPAVFRLLGFEPGEKFGGDAFLEVHPDDRPEVEREFRRVLEEPSGRAELQYRVRHADGSWRMLDTVAVNHVDDPSIRGILVSSRDITPLKQKEATVHARTKELRESEERFRQIAEHIEDVFWITTPAKEVMEYVSPAYETIWGRPCEELYTRPEAWLEAVVPADRDRVGEAIARQASGRYEEEYRIVRPDGEERWILDRGFPLRGQEGEVARIIGVAKDITEQKRAEERFSALGKEILDAVYVVSVDGIVLTASPSVYRLTGYRRAEIEGTHALESVHPEDREAVRATFEKVMADETRTLRGEYRIITKAGKVRNVECVGQNLLAHPAVGGILVTTRDVSERVALERRVRQMQKMESVGRLAVGIAHDFNNILTVILAQTDLLLLDLPPGPAAEEVGVIQAVANRAATLTQQLLAFSRDQVLQPRIVDLSAVVQALGGLIERLIGEDVRVVYRVSDGLPPVRLDPNQLEQVLLNLAVNARDAMPKGGTLTISVQEEELDEEGAEPFAGLEAGRYVVLAVSDTGVGMVEEVRRQVFEPYFTTKEKGKGTGLGLAMIYGTVKQSGGSIHVESEPGQGSTFFLRFPSVDADVAEEPLPPQEPARGLPQDRVTGRVLVVEDEPAVRMMVVKVLENRGFEVLEAGDAESGLELLAADEGVDVVLSDLMLPGMSGLDLVNRVRKLRSGFPIILMSGYAEGSLGQAAELPSEVTFVQKPFTPDRLIATIREVLGGR